ncbi:hypothetical protein JW796_00340 [Candidatus Dojkabacteria bacterium]|nr:hypothetical protein [Candidatus Dojkabacteria bacterium]
MTQERESGIAESSRYPFPERAGVKIGAYVEAIAGPPEIQLSADQRAEALSFEDNLTRSETLQIERRNDQGEVVEIVTAEGLEHIWKIKINLVELYVDYFLKDEGRKLLVDNLGLDPEVNDREAIISFLSSFDYSKVETQVVDKISGASSKYMGDQFTEAFRRRGFSDVRSIRNPTKIVVIKNPLNLAEKVEKLRALKRYHKIYRAELKKDGSDLSKAKLALLDIHALRTNEMIANLYPLFINFERQQQASGWRDQELFDVMKEGFFGIGIDETKTQTPTLRKLARLDRFKEGAGEALSSGNYGPISNEAVELSKRKKSASQVTEIPPLNQTLLAIAHRDGENTSEFSSSLYSELSNTLSPEGLSNLTKEVFVLKELIPTEVLGNGSLLSLVRRYGDESAAKLREIIVNIQMNASEIEGLWKKVLRRYELLSSTQTQYNTDSNETIEIDPETDATSVYSSDRNGRADDNKWQVIISPRVTIISVNSRKGTIFIPSGEIRKLGSTAPSGVIAISDHETMHILQHENKARIGLAITENIGTDRSSVNAEAGAIAWEREAKKRYLGQEAKVSKGLFRAVQERTKGRSFKACAKAFYDNYMEGIASPSEEKKMEGVKEAVKHTRRIFTGAGIFGNWSSYTTNSKPLAYIEQNLVAEELSNRGMSDLLAIGGVSLQTLAELNKVGLFDRSKAVLPEMRPSEIILEDVRVKILKTLTEHLSANL